MFQCLAEYEDGKLSVDAKPVDADIKPTQTVREIRDGEMVQVWMFLIWI